MPMFLRDVWCVIAHVEPSLTHVIGPIMHAQPGLSGPERAGVEAAHDALIAKLPPELKGKVTFEVRGMKAMDPDRLKINGRHLPACRVPHSDDYPTSPRGNGDDPWDKAVTALDGWLRAQGIVNWEGDEQGIHIDDDTRFTSITCAPRDWIVMLVGGPVVFGHDDVVRLGMLDGMGEGDTT